MTSPNTDPVNAALARIEAQLQRITDSLGCHYREAGHPYACTLLAEFHAGDRVYHGRYGPGVVTETDPARGLCTFRVRFDRQAETAPTHPGEWCAAHELIPPAATP